MTKRLGASTGTLPCQVLSKSCRKSKMIRSAIKAMARAVICITANAGLRAWARNAKRPANPSRLSNPLTEERANSFSAVHDSNANTAIAPPKLKPTQLASFQSRAAHSSKTAKLSSPNKATQRAATGTPLNSRRTKRTGETCTNVSNGGPAKPNNKNQERSALHRTGHSDGGGKSANNKLPKNHISPY